MYFINVLRVLFSYSMDKYFAVNEFFAGPGTDVSQRPARLRLRF